MKGKVVIPEGGITTIDVRIRTQTYENGSQIFSARVYVESYPACTIPLTYDNKISSAVHKGLTWAGLVETGGIDLDAYCAENDITINYHVLEAETHVAVYEWGTTGWEDDIRWHKGHELTYERIVRTRWPIDSRTTAMNVKTDEGQRTIERDSLFCETCNAVVQGVTLERTTELDLIINQRGEDLSKTYTGATK